MTSKPIQRTGGCCRDVAAAAGHRGLRDDSVFHLLSWGRVLVLTLGALFIFGPERLPTMAGTLPVG
jgi:hypothetical protein